jgi:hypothetical protein
LLDGGPGHLQRKPQCSVVRAAAMNMRLALGQQAERNSEELLY